MDWKKNKKLQDKAIKVLKKITDAGFSAYIVGGFVRDTKLKRIATDIDITTNAKPKDIREIFKNNYCTTEEYGSITVEVQGVYFEITTFRKEISYEDNRKPVEFIYIDTLEEDLKRRDFRINTLCMDKTGKIIDYLNAQQDLEDKIIHTVGEAKQKLREDSLRILRAIRFATVLDFKLSEEVKVAILENRYLLKSLSYERKKEELEKIFTSKNVENGIRLLLELGLDEYLELPKLKELSYVKDLCGIWALLNPEKYPFSKNEKELMKKIKAAYQEANLQDSLTLYQYDLYTIMVASDMKNYNKKEMIKKYNRLPIHKRSDLAIKGEEIIALLSIEKGPIINEILTDLETQVLRKSIKNKNLDLKKYIVKHYKKC